MNSAIPDFYTKRVASLPLAAQLAAAVPGSTEADWSVLGWRTLARLGAGNAAVDLTASGDGAYSVDDVDGRTLSLVAENTATADTLETDADGVKLAVSGGSKVTGFRLDMTALTGWDARKRTWVAVRLSDVVLGNNGDRIHMQITDTVMGAMTRTLAVPLERNGAADYRLDLYHYNGIGYDFETTGLLETDATGTHWLVAELTPGRVVARADLKASAALPDGPAASTKRSEADYYNRGHSTTETTLDALCGVLRVQLQATGAGACSVTLSDLYILQEGT